jgi:hypothetical protein
MNRKEGEPPGASYIQITTNGNPSDGPKWPTFEPPPNLHAELLEEGTFKDREMDIDRGKETALGCAAKPWMPGKCIPQAPQAWKYVINSPRIEEQKQYMRDYALVGKFLGLWPSKRVLVKWIQYWWKMRGHYDLHVGSKGFFTIIFHNLEDHNRIFDGGPYFYNST